MSAAYELYGVSYNKSNLSYQRLLESVATDKVIYCQMTWKNIM